MPEVHLLLFSWLKQTVDLWGLVEAATITYFGYSLALYL